MKTLIASALIATAALTSAAYAAPTATVSSEASYILPGADFSGLSATEVHTINAIVQSGDSFNDKAAAIRAQLN
ncbi:hypothetical protein [Antarctobacter jejuensis]|uniref:hypothetical protein n=1 Tax=Antarctobacter jejuensis TaxID=1439938 RepID=UPI003FD67C07